MTAKEEIALVLLTRSWPKEVLYIAVDWSGAAYGYNYDPQKAHSGRFWSSRDDAGGPNSNCYPITGTTATPVPDWDAWIYDVEQGKLIAVSRGRDDA